MTLHIYIAGIDRISDAPKWHTNAVRSVRIMLVRLTASCSSHLNPLKDKPRLLHSGKPVVSCQDIGRRVMTMNETRRTILTRTSGHTAVYAECVAELYKFKT